MINDDAEFGLDLNNDDLDLLKKGANKDRPNTPPSNADPDDVEFAREHVRRAIEIGLSALDNANGLVEASDDVRAFKVISSLIDSVSNASDRLVRLRDNMKAKEQQLALPHNQPPTQIVFSGSPADLLKELDSRKMKTIENAPEDKNQ